MKSSRWQNVLNHFSGLLLFAFIFLNALSAFAVPGKTTYQAKIVKPDGYPLEATSVNFKFTILDPVGSCILYSETYSSVNMSSTGGLISFALGSGVKTYPTSSTTFEQVFSNITPSLSCDTGGPANYSPTATDIRKIVMQFHDGTGWQTLPAMNINAVPYAMYANEATKLNGLTSSDFVQVSTVPSCAASEALRYTGAGFTCIAVGNSVTSSTVVTALGYTPADGASVTTLTSNVSLVSSTVFSVSSTVTSLQSSVAASFAAITSSQWTTSGTNIFYNTGNVGIGTTTPVTKLDVSGGVRIGAESTTCAPALAGTLRYNGSNVEYCNGTSWQAFGVSSSGLTSLNGSTSQTQIFANATGGTAPAFNTSNGVHTLNIPLASTGSVTAGLISNTDYTTFTNKITSSAASIAQVLGYVPANDAASGTYAQKANNLSDLTNVATARTNLGLGTFATASSIDLGSASATGTLAIARLPSFTGDATIAAASNTIILSNSGVTAGTYTKVTVDSKGRVTSSSALASTDVTTALGYTPASASAATQWTTSGTNIYYNTGNVGIGTSAPTGTLDVEGGTAAAATDGADITLQAQSAGSGNQNGGNVIIKAGALSGSGSNGQVLLGISTKSGWGNATVHTGNFAIGGILHMENNDIINVASIGSLANATGALPFNTNAGAESGRFDGSGRFLIGYTADQGGGQKLQVNSGAYFNGNVGISTAAPTAKLHLAAGTSSTASFKFTSGTLLTSPQSGTMEYDGTNFYLTDSTNTRRAIAANTNPGTYDNVSNINSSNNITLTPTGSVVVSSTTASTNSSTGALIVNGGLGVAGNLNVAGTISGSAKVLATGFRANQGSPDSNDSSTNGYAFGTDGDTGMFSPGSGAANGVIAFYGNNAELVRITASGAVGIGTTSPFSKLHMQRSAASASSYVAPNSTALIEDDDYALLDLATKNNGLAGVRFNAGSDTTGAIFYYGSTNPSGERLSLLASGTEKVSILPNGNVGIGTTSPAQKLEVSGGLRITGVGQIGPSGTYGYGLFQNGTSIFVGQMYGIASGIQFTDSAGANTMTVKDGGNVGIGTTNPSYPLDIKNQMRVGAQGGSDVTLIAGGSGYGSQIYQYYADGVLKNVFSANGNSYITAGNFGIGTSSPAASLDVGGVFKADAISRVVQSGYVREINGYMITHNNWPTCSLPAKIYTIGTFGANSGYGAMEIEVTGTHRGIESYFEHKKWVITYGDYISSRLVEKTGAQEYVDLWNGSSNGPYTDITPANGKSLQLIVNPYCGATKEFTVKVKYDTVVNFTPSTLISGSFPYVDHTSAITINPHPLLLNGNVGVGTNAPISPIHAYGGTAMTAGYNRTLTVHANHPSIQFKGISDSNHSAGILYDAQTSSEGLRFIVGATSDDVFGTGANVMSLQANGNVGIGTSAPGARFHIADFTGAGGKNLLIGDDSFLTDVDVSNTLGIYGNQDATQGHIRLGSSGPLISGYTGFVGIGNATPSYTLDVSGDLRITGTPYRNGGDIAWTVPSDARLKDVIRTYDRGLREIANLDMIIFKYKKDNPKQINSDKEYTGVIAQQVQEQIPEAVSVDKDGFLSLNTTPIFWAMINAIKELYSEVTGVSREVAAIKAENAELKKQNEEIKAYLCAKDPSAPMCK